MADKRSRRVLIALRAALTELKPPRGKNVFSLNKQGFIPSIKVGGFCLLLGGLEDGVYLADTLQLHFGSFPLSKTRSWICIYTRITAQGTYTIKTNSLVLFTSLAEFLSLIRQKNASQEERGREEGTFRAPGEQFKERYRM